MMAAPVAEIKVRLPRETHDMLKSIGILRGVHVNNLVVAAVERRIEEEKRYAVFEGNLRRMSKRA
jgi:hypothetical protein